MPRRKDEPTDEMQILEKELVLFLKDYGDYASCDKIGIFPPPRATEFRSKYFSWRLADNILQLTKTIRKSYFHRIGMLIWRQKISYIYYPLLIQGFTERIPFFHRNGDIDMYAVLALFAFAGESTAYIDRRCLEARMIRCSVYGFLMSKLGKKWVQQGGFETLVKFIERESDLIYNASNDAVTVFGCHKVDALSGVEPPMIGLKDEKQVVRLHGEEGWKYIKDVWEREKWGREAVAYYERRDRFSRKMKEELIRWLMKENMID